jgi:hypothetical protein
MPTAKVYDLEENRITREKQLSSSQITWFLSFSQSGDEILYQESLKNLFYFPTFLPIMCIFIAFTALEDGLVTSITTGDPFLTIAFICHILSFFLIVLYTIAQLFDYYHMKVSQSCKLFSRYILKLFLFGKSENILLLLHTFGQCFYLLSFVSRDICTECGNIIQFEKCLDDHEKIFPLNQAFFAYITIIILPIYFKSIHRHIILLSWSILTIFIIATYLYGHYLFQYYTILFVIFFFVSIYEFERYKMTSYLLSKQALIAEQYQAELVKEKGKMVETKLRTALIHQILPPRVADQIIAGSISLSFFSLFLSFFSVI